MSSTTAEFSEVLGRRVRMGAWEDQKVSTYRKIGSAIDEEHWDEGAELAAYFVDEAQVCFSLYRQWINDLSGFLTDEGVPADELAAADAAIEAKLSLPDGGPWNAHRQWDRFLVENRALTAALYRAQRDGAHAALDRMKETWRRCHDRDVDHVYGLMSEVQDRFGATGIARMYERLLVPLFAWRYQKFDISTHPWDEGLETLMLVACEAMRGHLVGPERTGDFELVETDDRYILRFDPCGSGGRTIRGDDIEGTPARMDPAYGWDVTREPASFNHYTPGVCLYCAHCIVLMEEMPIDRFGYPVRVIDPPVYGRNDDDGRPQKCQWQMFKDPTAVPAEYYERVGRTKPEHFGSEHFDAPPLGDAGAFGLPGQG